MNTDCQGWIPEDEDETIGPKGRTVMMETEDD